MYGHITYGVIHGKCKQKCFLDPSGRKGGPLPYREEDNGDSDLHGGILEVALVGRRGQGSIGRSGRRLGPISM